MSRYVRLVRDVRNVGDMKEYENYIEPGMLAKVSDGRENFWVQIIEEKRRGYYLGMIMNTLLFAKAYSFGSVISLHRDHILELNSL